MRAGSEGDVQAVLKAGILAQENGLLFIASEIWNELLIQGTQPNQKIAIQPFQEIANQQFEILIWMGDLEAARRFANTYVLPEKTRRELAERDFLDPETFHKLLAEYNYRLNRLSEEGKASWTFENLFAQLEVKANIATLASQIHYFSGFYDESATVLVNDTLVEVDSFALRDAKKRWELVVRDCAHQIAFLSLQGESARDNIYKVAKLGQQAQERLFFFQGDFEIHGEDQDAKDYLNSIALGLKSHSSLASWMYRMLSS